MTNSSPWYRWSIEIDGFSHQKWFSRTGFSARKLRLLEAQRSSLRCAVELRQKLPNLERDTKNISNDLPEMGGMYNEDIVGYVYVYIYIYR